jgi:hypothetical protein
MLESSTNIGLTYFHYVDRFLIMKVAERDRVIHGMLEEEYRRSREVLLALLAKAEKLPKGALNVRRKQVQGNEYVYHYLVRREGKRVINQHVSEKDLPELKKLIVERDRYRKEIEIYKKRMAYLERLLR